MLHSESLKELATALAKAQAEIENADKNANNSHFQSRYADLAEVINTTRPVLTKHGLAVIQLPGMEGGMATVETILTHTSGEWLSGVAASPLQKQDPQGVGSAITYLRRYSLAAVCNIAQEDDDAEAAVGRRSEAPVVRQAMPPRQNGETASSGEKCPKCKGAMWDNRATKKNPSQPDFKCRDKQCDGVIWPPKDTSKAKPERTYEDPAPEFPEYEDSLPF